MQKWLGLLLVFLLLRGCKKTEDISQKQENEASVFQYQKMPPKFTINSKAIALIETWDAFKALSESMEVLYKARNNEDVILAIDDLIEKEKLLAQSSYPALFNTLQVKSRQRVLRTYLYRVKFSILENQSATTPTVEMLEAYNALCKQLNRIVKSQLDKALLWDTE